MVRKSLNDAFADVQRKNDEEVFMKNSYRIDEAAARWHVHHKTVERAIKRGEVEAFKIGSTWRIRSDEVDRVEKKTYSTVQQRTL